jgi:hypothetical protein
VEWSKLGFGVHKAGTIGPSLPPPLFPAVNELTIEKQVPDDNVWFGSLTEQSYEFSELAFYRLLIAVFACFVS